MGTLFVVLASLAVGAILVIGMAAWVSTKRAVFRNVVAFLMAAGSSYSLGFLIHMWVLVGSGEIAPATNVIWPTFTWLFIAVVCFVGAILTTASPYALALPFALIAAVALMLAPSMHDVVIAIPLFLVGTGTFFYQRQRLSRKFQVTNPIETPETIFTPLLGYAIAALLLLYALAQIYAGFIGIQHHWGQWWAVAAVLVAFIFRLTLPLTIGAFFGALNVWGWHWLGALVFAAPGLAFMALMIPGTLALGLGRLRK